MRFQFDFNIKNKDEGKNGRESNDEIKVSFSNHRLMVRLNLSSDDVRNGKETTTFVKERNLQIKV